ncbi:MAG TPA: HAD family hydrolase [Chromatiales bacterium]|nr:HAD family hydrolase [Chromatiales bacterium]
MALAIFDLDNTLLAGDSDYLWGVFLSEQGVVDRDQYERENRRFYEDYLAGRLDIYEWLRFSLRPLRENDPERLFRLRERFMRETIEPLISKAALDLIQKHRRAGDVAMIITATNSFITRPIAERLDIEHLIATEPEVLAGRFTGEVIGTPTFREGKVKRLEAWLHEEGQDLRGSHFYSDSHNDLPLLERVDHPVAVDPDETLATIARERDWPILPLHS